MGDNLNKLFIFTAGAAIGSVVTWKLVKTKYERIAQEEIDSVKEVFSRNHRIEIEPVDEACDGEEIEETIKNYQSIASNYSNESNEEDDDYDDEPYVISPDEFGEEEDYDQISLTYYSDNKLADDKDVLVEDIYGTVGYDALESFGKYEEDAVHVRNDKLKSYFEILRDLRKYSEVTQSEEEED